MRRQEKARLEAAGWKVGSAREFPGLTDAEAAVVEVKLELAKALRDQRARRKMTQEEAGRVLGSSQSRVAKMEAGDPSVSIDLLVRALQAGRQSPGSRAASRGADETPRRPRPRAVDAARGKGDEDATAQPPGLCSLPWLW